MRLPRDILLPVSFVFWVAAMTWLYIEENRRDDVRVPTLADLVFRDQVEPLAQKGIYLQLDESGRRRVRVGRWHRRIRRPDAGVRVETTVDVRIPEALLGPLRTDLTVRLAGVPLFEDLFAHPRILLESTLDLDEHGAFLSAVSRVNMLGRVFESRSRPRAGRIEVTWQEGAKTATRIQPRMRGLDEIGFYPVEDINLGQRWDILILDFTDTRPERPHAVTVQAVGTAYIRMGGRRAASFLVRGTLPKYRDVMAHYDGQGRVLREQGVFWPLKQLVFEREPPGAVPGKAGARGR